MPELQRCGETPLQQETRTPLFQHLGDSLLLHHNASFRNIFIRSTKWHHPRSNGVNRNTLKLITSTSSNKLSQNLCLYVTNNTWKLVVFRSKIGNFGKNLNSNFVDEIGNWTDSVILAKITTWKPITCSFWRCSVLALFHHIWWVMRAQH